MSHHGPHLDVRRVPPYDLGMRLVRACVFAMVASGCYVENPYVVAVAPAQTMAPPEAVDVYYEPRPGYVYVNGRYSFINGSWAWQRGYYVPERPGYVFVQGYWNGGAWTEGRWEASRPGYVHTEGYWEPRGRGYDWRPGVWEREREGHVFVRGGWASGPGGTRTYQRGRWEHRGYRR